MTSPNTSDDRVEWTTPPDSAIYNLDGTKGTKDIYACFDERQAWVQAPACVPGEKFTKKVLLGPKRESIELTFWKPTDKLASGWRVLLGTFKSEHGWDVRYDWVVSQEEAIRMAEGYLLIGEYPRSWKRAEGWARESLTPPNVSINSDELLALINKRP